MARTKTLTKKLAADFAAWKRLIESRRDEVGKLRDQINEDIADMQALAESCKSAYEAMESAVQTLSEYA